jgi:hypothetical protein
MFTLSAYPVHVFSVHTIFERLQPGTDVIGFTTEILEKLQSYAK